MGALRSHHTSPRVGLFFFFCFFLWDGWGPDYDRLGRSGASETVYKNTTAFGGAAVITRFSCIKWDRK